MRRTILIAMLSALMSVPVSADMADDCFQEADWDLKMGACTAVIRSGQWSGKSLAGAYNNRGIAYGALGQHARAIEDYDQALRLEPGDFNAYYNRGAAYRALGQHARAVEDYDQALRLDPGHASAYRNRGVAYESLGNADRAVADWERGIEIEGASRIRWWQEWTRDHGGHYSGASDGIYGPDIRAALIACARDPDC